MDNDWYGGNDGPDDYYESVVKQVVNVIGDTQILKAIRKMLVKAGHADATDILDYCVANYEYCGEDGQDDYEPDIMNYSYRQCRENDLLDWANESDCEITRGERRLGC